MKIIYKRCCLLNKRCYICTRITTKKKYIMRTATIEDFKVGTELFMKKGGWCFVIREKYDEGIWETNKDKVVFEGEAEHYEVAE